MLANATPKSDIEIRIPIANTTIRTSSIGSEAPPTLSPNGASIVSARRLLIANAAPTIVGRCECAAASGWRGRTDVQMPVRRGLVG